MFRILGTNEPILVCVSGGGVYSVKRNCSLIGAMKMSRLSSVQSAGTPAYQSCHLKAILTFQSKSSRSV